MSDVNNRRLSKKVLLRDVEVYDVLQGIAGYIPTNPALTLAALLLQKQTKDTKQADEVQAVAAMKAERDNAVAEEKAFHLNVLAAIDQVRAQFGENSNEYQAVGRKKKSEHKSPKRKKVDN